MNHPFKALRERLPQVDVTCERVDFLAVDEDLDAQDRRQVHRQRVHDCKHRQRFEKRAARMVRAHLPRQIDERVAALGHEHQPQFRSPRDHRHERRRRGQLGLDDRACLLGDFRRVGHLVLRRHERHAVVAQVVERRRNLARGWRLRGIDLRRLRLRGRGVWRLRPGTIPPGKLDEQQPARENDQHGNGDRGNHATVHRTAPPVVARNRMIPSRSPATTAF
jgi:hypothetical protein